MVDPGRPGFEEARWVVTEDVNVEHMLDVFTSLDMDSDSLWACMVFMRYLSWHKPRYTVLGPKIEGLADGHPFKPKYLIHLSGLSGRVGNRVEEKRLISHALKLAREREDDLLTAVALSRLSEANRVLGLSKEGIQQTKEALAIHERLGITMGQADCWEHLAALFLSDGQLDAAEKARLHVIDLLPEKGEEFRFCKSHRSLGMIYGAKGERAKAIHHFEKALGIASAFGWRGELFWIHYALAELFGKENEFDDAHSHIDQAKSYATDNAHSLGRAMEYNARVWRQQHRLEVAVSEALGALEIYEKIGASVDMARCKHLLQELEQLIAGELPKMMLLPIPVDPPFSAHGTKSLFKSLITYLRRPRS